MSKRACAPIQPAGGRASRAGEEPTRWRFYLAASRRRIEWSEFAGRFLRRGSSPPRPGALRERKFQLLPHPDSARTAIRRLEGRRASAVQLKHRLDHRRGVANVSRNTRKIAGCAARPFLRWRNKTRPAVLVGRPEKTAHRCAAVARAFNWADSANEKRCRTLHWERSRGGGGGGGGGGGMWRWTYREGGGGPRAAQRGTSAPGGGALWIVTGAVGGAPRGLDQAEGCGQRTAWRKESSTGRERNARPGRGGVFQPLPRTPRSNRGRRPGLANIPGGGRNALKVTRPDKFLLGAGDPVSRSRGIPASGRRGLAARRPGA